MPLRYEKQQREQNKPQDTLCHQGCYCSAPKLMIKVSQNCSPSCSSFKLPFSLLQKKHRQQLELVVVFQTVAKFKLSEADPTFDVTAVASVSNKNQNPVQVPQRDTKLYVCHSNHWNSRLNICRLTPLISPLRIHPACHAETPRLSYVCHLMIVLPSPQTSAVIPPYPTQQLSNCRTVVTTSFVPIW